jgi:hypothetical protein
LRQTQSVGDAKSDNKAKVIARDCKQHLCGLIEAFLRQLRSW